MAAFSRKPWIGWVLFGSVIWALSADADELRRTAFSGGGVRTESTSRILRATIGEAGVVGAVTSDSQRLQVGFWAGRTNLTPSSTDPIQEPVIRQNALMPGQPNPFTSTTDLRFAIASTSQVRLQVYDLSGRLVRTVSDQVYEPGSYGASWDGRDASGSPLANGLYFVRLDVGSWSTTRKVVKLH